MWCTCLSLTDRSVRTRYCTAVSLACVQHMLHIFLLLYFQPYVPVGAVVLDNLSVPSRRSPTPPLFLPSSLSLFLPLSFLYVLECQTSRIFCEACPGDGMVEFIAKRGVPGGGDSWNGLVTAIGQFHFLFWKAGVAFCDFRIRVVSVGMTAHDSLIE